MYLVGKEQSPLNNEYWETMNEIVINTAKKILIGRRFLPIFGPLGAYTHSIFVDVTEGESVKRKYYPLKQIYNDFIISWNDIEYILANRGPYDFSQVSRAALECAKMEDEFIFWGCQELNLEGILTSTGTNKIKKGNWDEEEVAYTDIVRGIELLIKKGFAGKFVLVLSPNVYAKLARLNKVMGIPEIEIISKLVNGNIYQTPVIGDDRSVLICAEFANIDLTIGQDLTIAYIGNDKLDHEFRIIETIVLRIKNKDSIVIFE